ncbi:hypothetical protein [Chitinophaga ginsengisoli]|uniref:MarR family transcriptional regulator n=1 Tax=Chitinophaga ginsengisoli TaxID=363837 RepID=A0A2P8FUQ6_9BACT|nr:hypothetical protein [Chitinophaga ginsengisoli]PSL25456.1 hypothetical protein CLV42_113138 [Chitinophaga ginsengisoli]
MVSKLTEIEGYIKMTLGIEATFDPVASEQINNLPLHVVRAYDLYVSMLESQKCVFALANETEDATPVRLKKDGELISKTLHAQVVYVFATMQAYRRLRLVQQKVAFMVPGKQLYMPFMALSFTEVAKKVANKKLEKLRPATQLLFLYHLQIGSLEHITFAEIAHHVQYSNMSVSRAAEELQEFGLAHVTGSRGKQLVFIDKGKKLWETALPFLQSPVKIEFYVEYPPGEVEGRNTGYHALAKYSTLKPGLQPEIAISLEEYRRIALPYGNMIDFFDGLFRIEAWNYSPYILSKEMTVDPLSLYLSKQSSTDERVQIALEQLISNIQW